MLESVCAYENWNTACNQALTLIGMPISTVRPFVNPWPPLNKAILKQMMKDALTAANDVSKMVIVQHIF